MEPRGWITLLSEFDGIHAQPGAPPAVLDAVEEELGAALPTRLRHLYTASDGIWDDAGQWFVVWPLSDLVARNRLVFGELDPGLIGFGDDGTGSPFCVRRGGGDDVYYWSPILAEVTRLASDPAAFWRAWMTDTLPPH